MMAVARESIRHSFFNTECDDPTGEDALESTPLRKMPPVIQIC